MSSSSPSTCTVAHSSCVSCQGSGIDSAYTFPDAQAGCELCQGIEIGAGGAGATGSRFKWITIRRTGVSGFVVSKECKSLKKNPSLDHLLHRHHRAGRCRDQHGK